MQLDQVGFLESGKNSTWVRGEKRFKILRVITCMVESGLIQAVPLYGQSGNRTKVKIRIVKTWPARVQYDAMPDVDAMRAGILGTC